VLYHQVLADVIRLCAVFKQLVNTMATGMHPQDLQEVPRFTPQEPVDKFFASLVQECLLLVTVRREISSIYYAMYAEKTIPNFEKLIKETENVQEKVPLDLTNAAMSSIKRNLVCEVACMHTLFVSAGTLRTLLYKDCILSLFHARLALDQWRIYLTEQGKTLSPAFVWLQQFYGALHAKTGLYFSSVLHMEEDAFGAELRREGAKADVNYFTYMDALLQKTDCTNVSLIVDTTKLPVEFCKQGYQCHEPNWNWKEQMFSGVRSYPVVYSYPKEPPVLAHWPVVISLFYALRAQLDTYSVPIHHIDNSSTYYLVKIEPQLYMVVIFEKKKDSDHHASEIINTIAMNLRLTKVIKTLS